MVFGVAGGGAFFVLNVYTGKWGENLNQVIFFFVSWGERGGDAGIRRGDFLEEGASGGRAEGQRQRQRGNKAQTKFTAAASENAPSGISAK